MLSLGCESGTGWSHRLGRRDLTTGVTGWLPVLVFPRAVRGTSELQALKSQSLCLHLLYLSVISVLFCFGEGNGNPLQYSCLENSMDRGAWRASGHGVAKDQT